MAKKSFEDSLEQLEKITNELEQGDLSLEKALKKFDEGIKLAEYCNRKLEDAQKKIDILLNKNGTLKSVPFETSEQPPEDQQENDGY